MVAILWIGRDHGSRGQHKGVSNSGALAAETVLDRNKFCDHGLIHDGVTQAGHRRMAGDSCGRIDAGRVGGWPQPPTRHRRSRSQRYSFVSASVDGSRDAEQVVRWREMSRQAPGDSIGTAPDWALVAACCLRSVCLCSCPSSCIPRHSIRYPGVSPSSLQAPGSRRFSAWPRFRMCRPAKRPPRSLRLQRLLQRSSRRSPRCTNRGSGDRYRFDRDGIPRPEETPGVSRCWCRPGRHPESMAEVDQETTSVSL